jgi:H+/Cl- antiporter ClcA
MNDLIKVFLLALVCGIVASLLGVLVALFGKKNEERLQVGNASGIGFLIGASIGALIGIFQSFLGRL